jgi:hypothetical protein
MGRRLAKGIFFIFSSALFLLLVFLILELFARIQIPRDRARIFEQATPLQVSAWQKNKDYLATHPEAEGSAPQPAQDQSNWSTTLQSTPEGERSAIAQRDNAWYLLCSRDGVLLEVYSPEGSGGGTDANRGIFPGANVFALLGDKEAEDWRNAQQSLAPGLVSPARFYDVHFTNGDGMLWEWTPVLILRLNGDEAILIRARNAIWETFPRRFRKNVFVPDYKEHSGAVPFQTNSQGWRDDEVALPKPAGVYRVVCIGGSTTVGGPRNDLTYPNMVERKLRERLHSDRIEVVNCGIYAASTQLIRDQLSEYLALEPDLIIHYDFINDFLPINQELISSNIPFPLSNLVRHSDALRYYANRLIRPPAAALRSAYRQTILENFTYTISEARRIGAQVALASFAYPTPEVMAPLESQFFLLSRGAMWSTYLDTDGYAYAANEFNDELAQFCAENNILYIPVAEKVRGGLDTFMDMCHMQLGAMDAMAQTVADTIAPMVEEHLAKQPS